ncbi:MAG: hypothetical protein ABI683_13430, partial [Ginsengibacter sp.]
MKKYLLCLLIISNYCYSQDSVAVSDIESTEKIIRVHFNEAKLDSLSGSVRDRAKQYDKMHHYPLDNSVPMTMAESPVLPHMQFNTKQLPVKFTLPQNISIPANKDELAFYSISQLASLIKSKKITSVELTRFFIDRLKKYGDTLQCVISLTENAAMEQAAQADKEIAAG